MKLISKLRHAVPHWAWSGIVTGTAVSLPVFVTALVGWVRAAEQALLVHEHIPSFSVVTSAAIALAVGALGGIGNAGWRYFQTKLGLGAPPVYPDLVKLPVDQAAIDAHYHDAMTGEATLPSGGGPTPAPVQADPITLPPETPPEVRQHIEDSLATTGLAMDFSPPADPETEGTSGPVEAPLP